MIAAGNSGEGSLVASVRALLADASPLVRGAAVWALSRLMARATFGDLAEAALPGEDDAVVCDEWRSALDEATSKGTTA